jgi:hypothetical protein
MNTNYGVLLYGPRYIGTTSFAKALPNPYIYNFDSWKDFYREVLSETETTADNMGMAPLHYVLDNFSKYYEMCIAYICEENSVDNIHELGANKWDLVKEEYKTVMFAFAKLPGVKWYICDEEAKEVNTSLFTGTIISPKLSWLEKDIWPLITDQTLYMGVKTFKREIDDEGKEIRTRIKPRRVFICSPLSGIVSGDNLGLLPKGFPAGESGEEAVSLYTKFMKGPKENG